jgi:hypothetical protein
MQSTRIAIPAALMLLAWARPALADEEPSGDSTKPPAVDLPAPSPGPSQSEGATVNADVTPAPAKKEQSFWKIGTGLRVGYITSAAFDPFASSDALPMFSLDATRSFEIAPATSVAVGLRGEIGGRADMARGSRSLVTVSSASIPVEARYRFRPWIYGFAAASPGVAMFDATIRDYGAPGNSIEAAPALFVADLSLGASFGIPLLAKRQKARLWFTPEIGYTVSSSRHLTLAPSGRDDRTVSNSVDLGSLSLAGVFWRATSSISF